MTRQRRAGWLMTFAALVLGRGGVGAQAPGAGGPESRLFLAEFSLGAGLDPRYQREYQRLEQLCKPFTPGCMAKHFPTPVRERLTPLRAGPDTAAPVIGYVVGVMLVPAGATAGLTIVLDVETSESPARSARWMTAIGDWGYGIHVAGVRSQGDWVQLVGLPLVGDAWLPTGAPDFGSIVEPLAGSIVTLRSLPGQGPDGARRTIPAGDYVVTRLVDGAVELRAEIATDMPCDADAKPPAVVPPLLRAAPEAFFDADGTPRFATKYRRGC